VSVDDSGVREALGGGLRVKDTALTNEQVKSLPSAVVELVPAPGVGTILLFHHAVFLAKRYVGSENEYTNIQDYASMWIASGDGEGGGGHQVSQFLADDSGAGATFLSGLLTGPTSIEKMGVNGRSYPGWDMMSFGAIIPNSENLPLVLVGDNSGGGDWTGGHDQNTFGVRVWYSFLETNLFG
jgi:hypothetical protein